MTQILDPTHITRVQQARAAAQVLAKAGEPRIVELRRVCARVGALSLIGLVIAAHCPVSAQPLGTVQQESNVEQLTRQAIESQDCCGALSSLARLKATEGITRVAFEAKSISARVAATEMLSDQAVLQRLAGIQHHGMVRAAAVERLSDQVLLKKFALHDSDNEVRNRAVQRLTDQTLLAKLALQNDSASVSVFAARGITESHLLHEVATRSKDPVVREVVVERIADPKVLEQLSRTERDAEVQLAIMTQTRSGAILTNLAAITYDVRIGGYVAVYLNDLASIQRIASQSNSAGTRELAKFRLFVEDAVIRERLANLSLYLNVGSIAQDYSAGPGRGGYIQHGESLELRVFLGGKPVAIGCWSAKFPQRISGRPRALLPATVDVAPLARALIELAAPDASAGGRSSLEARFEALVRPVARQASGNQVGSVANADSCSRDFRGPSSNFVVRSGAITDHEVRQQYEALQAGRSTTHYRVRHIQVDREERARELIAQIQRGERFEDLARAVSIDAASAARGGDIGFAKADKYNPDIRAAVEKLKKGDLLDQPVKTSLGWHVVRLEDVREGAFPSFEELRDEIRERLEQDRHRR